MSMMFITANTRKNGMMMKRGLMGLSLQQDRL
jgi:hypothetical protein